MGAERSRGRNASAVADALRNISAGQEWKFTVTEIAATWIHRL
jgi:hypothetical protein